MLTTKRLIKFLALFMAVALLVTACDRPFPSGGDDDPTPTTEAYPGPGEEQAEGATPEPTRAEVETGETPAAETEEEPAEEVPAEETPTEPEGGEEPAEGEGEGETGEEPGAEEPEAEAEETPAAEGEGEGEAEAPEPTQEAGEADPTGEPAPEGMEEEQTAEPESTEGETAEGQSSGAAPLPATHTVAAGENLYRIGLQYGMSWVAIARHNNIQNPNRIFAGQVLQIPGGDSGSGGQPGPVPTPEGINYIVKPGDTLFKIGQRFGISWTEIAEANGLVNPDQIYAGQTLKIPVDAPAPPTTVHHVVQPGETLFRISLQYGVPWLAIARANHISPPFYIFAGQTLVIPGGH